jgi:hypothetical protein
MPSSAAPATAGDELERIVKEARHAFIIAKSDGVLDAGEVVQIALVVAKGVQKIGSLSGAEKRAVVMLALKKGLEAAGGLPAIAGASPETMRAVEEQLFAAAGAAIDAAVAIAQGKLDLRKPAAWKAVCLPLCSAAAAAAAAAVPKDQPILQQALAFAAGAGAPATRSEAAGTSQGSAVLELEAPAPVPAADSSPAQSSETVPSPQAPVQDTAAFPAEVSIQT